MDRGKAFITQVLAKAKTKKNSITFLLTISTTKNEKSDKILVFQFVILGSFEKWTEQIRSHFLFKSRHVTFITFFCKIAAGMPEMNTGYRESKRVTLRLNNMAIGNIDENRKCSKCMN